jgi:hypothetical protein
MPSTKVCEKLQSLHFSWTLTCFFSIKFCEQLQSLHFTRSMDCETIESSRQTFVKNGSHCVFLELWFACSKQVCWSTDVTSFYSNMLCETKQISRLRFVKNSSHFTLPEPRFICFDQVMWATAGSTFYSNFALWDATILSSKIYEKPQSLRFTWAQICLFRPSFVSNCSHYILFELWFVRRNISLD